MHMLMLQSSVKQFKPNTHKSVQMLYPMSPEPPSKSSHQKKLWTTPTTAVEAVTSYAHIHTASHNYLFIQPSTFTIHITQITIPPQRHYIHHQNPMFQRHKPKIRHLHPRPQEQIRPEHQPPRIIQPLPDRRALHVCHVT